MTTWRTIFGVDGPIRMTSTEVRVARDAFDRMRDDAEALVGSFDTVREHGNAPDHLEGQAGTMFARLLDDMDGGLRDLPRVAGEVHGIFSAHHDRIVQLEASAEGALARAVTAWERRGELDGEIATLQGQLDQLDQQAEDDPEADLGDERDGTSSSLATKEGERQRQQGILDAIYGDADSEWAQLRADEDARNSTTVDELDGVDLGDLEDPGFFDKLVGGITGFIGGVLDSIANLLEAFVTGDWATFFHELKRLMDVALLVLGTIALFTGVGAPLFLLAAANFAVTTGLYLTQTPNPQTGETIGLADVAWAAAGMVMSAPGFLTTVRGPNGLRLFTQTTTAGRAANGRYISVLSGTRAPGALATLRTNLGALNTIRTAPISAHGSWQSLATFTKTVPYHTSTPLARGALYTDAVVSTVWRSRGAFNAVNAFNPASGDAVKAVTGSGGWTGSSNALFGPGAPSRAGVARIASQMRADPDVHIVPAA